MNDHTSNLSGHMLVVSGGILVSRVLGLARDIVFAYVFGTGTALAAFVIANTFPNLLREMFGEGAFSHAMVPVFSSTLEREGRATAWQGACRVISSLALVVATLVGLAIAAVVLLRPWFAGELAGLTLRLTPWLLPYAVLVCLSAALAAVLNSLGRFALPAYSQVIMNLALIAGALLPFLWLRLNNQESQVWFLVAAVLLAGIIQAYLHLRSCRKRIGDFAFAPRLRDPMVGQVARLMAPALLGVGVMQVNIVVDRLLAGWLGELATTSLYYSQRLIYLPVGLFGVAMGIVALPAMSRAWARAESEPMLDSLRTALRHVLFATLPTVAMLAALRYPVVRLLFERGGFTDESTRATVWAMVFYLPGIPAFACVKIAVTPFYARHDTRTPVRIAAWCLALNVVLNLILMQFLAQGGLALATTICSFVNVFFLLLLAARRLQGEALRGLLRPVLRMAAAALFAYFAATAVLGLIPVRPGFWPELMRVFPPLLAGGGSYLGLALVLGCREPREMLAGNRA